MKIRKITDLKEILMYLCSKYGSYLSRRQLAEELCVSQLTIRRAEKSGRIIALHLSSRCVRYPAESAAEYILGSVINMPLQDSTVVGENPTVREQECLSTKIEHISNPQSEGRGDD